MIQLAIFASGNGTNAQRIIGHFSNHPTICVALVVSSNGGAGVVNVARQANIPVLIIEKERFFSGDAYVADLHRSGTQFIVLAGFLWKIPTVLINAFSNKIINIHPALLPKYGGRGMYGHHVHGAVIAAGDAQSGISIHYVDEWYDHGNIIFQASCSVDPGENPASLAAKIHALEHRHYPAVIEDTVKTAKA